MQLNPTQLVKFEEVVLTAKKILLVVHKNPDGDALGSELALYLALTRAGKDVVPACADPVPDAFRFLPGSERIVSEFDPQEFDLVIVLDCGDLKQTKYLEIYPELFSNGDLLAHSIKSKQVNSKQRTIVKIDHHHVATEFGDIQIVHEDAPATCCILTHLFQTLSIKIRPDMATCLLTGIYTDTGSFKHSNTTPETLRTAAVLLRSGANLPTVAKNIFRTTPVSTMKLWGRILDTLKQTNKGVTLAVAKEKDFTDTGAKVEELAGVVDYVNAVPDAQFSILLSERDGQVKASLRTLRDDVNVAAIAASFGGGGHVKAAGFAVPGKLEEERMWKVVGS